MEKWANMTNRKNAVIGKCRTRGGIKRQKAMIFRSDSPGTRFCSDQRILVAIKRRHASERKTHAETEGILSMQIAVCDDNKEAEQLAVLIGRCPQYKEIPADICWPFEAPAEYKKRKEIWCCFYGYWMENGDTGIDFASRCFMQSMRRLSLLGYAIRGTFFSNKSGQDFSPKLFEKLDELAEIEKRGSETAGSLKIKSDRKSLEFPACGKQFCISAWSIRIKSP